MLNIRAMEEKDIPQVEEIEKKIFSLPWSEKSFHDACSDENNIYLVCEDEGTITGYCGLWTVFGEGDFPFYWTDLNDVIRGIAATEEECKAQAKEQGCENIVILQD